MRPPSLHCKFFSSLKQVEKRLKLEENQPDSSSTPSHVPETNSTPTQSLSTPLYLHFTHPSPDTNVSNTVQDSEPPLAFMSSSQQFFSTNETQPQMNPPDSPTTSKDTNDIQYLIQLLGLSDNLEEETQKREKKHKTVVCGGNSCGCECGFYEKIVGVKGPKCEKEVERMEGWIKYFSRNGNEPLRLTFLLMGKAAFESVDDDSMFESLEFPSAIDEFLKIDPPKD